MTTILDLDSPTKTRDTTPDDVVGLSALVVAHNEEENLPDCLAALRFCDEIVVVLDRCSDGSKGIAELLADRVVEGAWPIEGDRRNFGNQACRGAWVLEIDADERVGPELATEIRQVCQEGRYDYFRLPVDNYIGKRLVRYGWGASIGVSSVARLCRKGVKTWGLQRVHPKLAFRDDSREGPRLSNRLIHYADRNISDLIKRLDSYSTAQALDLRDSGDLGTAAHNYRRIFSRFWKCFVARKGYREGGMGFIIAVCAGLLPILSYLKAVHDGEDA